MSEPSQPAAAGGRPAVGGSGGPTRRAAAFAGIVATGAALATGELLAGVLAGIPSPILSVGRLVVDLQPPGAKEIVVSLFGTADKLALEILVLVAALAIGAGLGRPRPGSAGYRVRGPRRLRRHRRRGRPPRPRRPAHAGGACRAGRARRRSHRPRSVAAPGAFAVRDRRRRSAHARPTGPAARSSSAAGACRSPRSRPARSAARSSIASARPRPAPSPRRRPPRRSLPAPTSGSRSSPRSSSRPRTSTGSTPPSSSRTSTATPGASGSTGWSTARSRSPTGISSQLPVIEQYVTIACVSNRVGGDLIGNAKWTGVRLRDVLDLAGVRDGATQLVGRSADGWTAGMPVAWIMDPEREPMIALGMNGQPLPREHGFPARLIVPGLYGYVSATKWVTELELTTLEAFDAYWVPLGWAKEAPILTQSRIDRPGRDARIPAGPYAIAGVAWADGPRRREGRGPGGRRRVARGDACRRRSRTRPGSSGGSTGTRSRASTGSASGPRMPPARPRPRTPPGRTPTAPGAGTPSRSRLPERRPTTPAGHGPGIR